MTVYFPNIPAIATDNLFYFTQSVDFEDSVVSTVIYKTFHRPKSKYKVKKNK
jgi:hypothetical protein